MAKPVQPINTATSLPAIAPSSSRWNHKTVTVVLALTAVGFLLYTLFTRYMSTSQAPTKKSPPQSLGEDSSVPFTSGLTYQGNPCVNELKLPKFEKYASGIIRFDSKIFETVDPSTAFHLQCKGSTGAIFFKTSAITGAGNLDFFVSNLPFGKTITVNFWADEIKIEGDMSSIDLKIEQTAGLYTIRENEAGDSASYESVAWGGSKVLSPLPVSPLCTLAELSGLTLTPEKVVTTIKHVSKPSNEHLSITNLGERSVFHLLLVSINHDIPVQERAIALPIIINAKQTATFPLQLLKNMWATQYNLATEKNTPASNLLCLAGVQQIICPEVKA